MSDLFHPQEGRKAKLDLITGRDSTVLISKLFLFKSNTVISGTSTYAGLTLANFSGYAEISLTSADFAAPGLDGDDAICLSLLKTFTHDGGGTANIIYGLGIRSAHVAPKLLYAKRFAAPLSLSVLGDFVPVQVRLREGQYPIT